jgi:hypothetical protein
MRKSIEERFLDKVVMVPEAGCWLWMGYTTKDGHGKFWHLGAMPTAHRASWAIFNGPIPEGMQVLHKCDVACCVNPHHLYLGTNQDNVRDRVARGRSAPVDKENAPNAKLSPEAVAAIRRKYAMGSTQWDLSYEFKISRSQIGNIVNNRQWVEA